MNFEETGACGINKRKYEISMSDEEYTQYEAFIDWRQGQGKDTTTVTIAWDDERNADEERVAETSEDFYKPMFRTLDSLCDDIPDETEFKPLIEEITDEMAAYFEG